MSDKEWYLNEDGSRYAVFLQIPDDPDEQYGVDLVRHAQDEHGLMREQRLTLAQYNSYGEAEEHLYEAEQQIQDSGLEDFDVDALATMPYSDTPTILTAHYPPDATGDELTTTNVLAISEDGIQATRLAEGDLETQASLVAQLDLAQMEGGDDRLLNEATELAETQGQHAPATLLFTLQDVEESTNTLPFTLDDNLQPFGTNGDAIPHLVDGGGTVHWFGIVERDAGDEMSHDLRYFRAHEGQDDEIHHDSYPVMPLPDGERETAWVLPDLERHLQAGNIYTAQQLAYNVAEVYEQDFPDPLDLPALNPEPEYYFGYGVGPSDLPSLEAVKTWMEGAERRFDTLTIGEYGMYDEAAVDERELEAFMDEKGIEPALNLAESMAVAGGYLDPERDDPRIFFEGDAPPDAFTTNRERGLADPSYSIGAISANGESFLDVYKEWGTDGYERLVVPQPDWEVARDNAVIANEMLDEDRLQDAMRLVEVAGIEAGVIDLERDDPRLFTQGPLDPFQTTREEEIDDELARYGVTWRESHEWATEVEQIRKDADIAKPNEFELIPESDERHLLEPLDSTVNYAVVVQVSDPDTLELAVEKVWKAENDQAGFESQTVQTYDLDDREVAEAERYTLLEVYDERGLEAMMHKAELQAMQNGYLDADRVDTRLFREGPPDRFETLAQQLEGEINPYWNTDGEVIEDPEPDPQAQNPYWRLETIPVNDPEGEPLGHALHMVVYDGVEHDPERMGTPPMAEDEPFRMLEMAHFDTTEAADKFGKEFNGYLMPGLLEGPELAVEVARLEELPVDWKSLEGDALKAYQDGKYTLTRDPSDWHPYNPNAERDARIAAEGIYTDPIHEFTKFDEGLEI